MKESSISLEKRFESFEKTLAAFEKEFYEFIADLKKQKEKTQQQ